MNKILGLLASKWRRQVGPKTEPDVIVCLGFTITKGGRLTNSAENILEGAVGLSRKYPRSRVAYGIFKHSPAPELETRLKESRLCQGGVANDKMIRLGEVSSTLTEAETAKEVFGRLGLVPKNIAVVTGAAHSRSVYFIWRIVFPRTDIAIETFGLEKEIDSEDPMTLLRSGWLWFLSNVSRHLVFRTVYFLTGMRGLRKLRWIRQPTL